MSRISRRRREKLEKVGVKLPLRVKDAQKILAQIARTGDVPASWDTKQSAVYFLLQEVFNSSLNARGMRKKLDRLASQDPNQVLVNADGDLIPPITKSERESQKQTDEVAPQSESPSDESEKHGGDGNAQEAQQGGGGLNNNQPQQSQADSQPSDDGGEGTAAPVSGESDLDRGSETSDATSEGDQSEESSQNAGFEQANSTSTDRVEPNDTQDNNISRPSQEVLRDERSFETIDSDPLAVNEELATLEQSDCGELERQDKATQCAEEKQPADDRPTHQKKWGRKIGEQEAGRLSSSASTNTGGATAHLDGTKISLPLLKLARQKMAALVGGSEQTDGPRYDYGKFCTRLLTYRNPRVARKQEEGRPAILLLADISGSCSSFSGESVAVGRAVGCLGVPGADMIVVSHSNGVPYELEINGVQQNGTIDKEGGYRGLTDKTNKWYEVLLTKYQVTIAIALGDWDAAYQYEFICNYPTVEKFLWLDNAHCSSRGTVVDNTKKALDQAADQGMKFDRHKLIYRDGCKDAIAFINNIKF